MLLQINETAKRVYSHTGYECHKPNMADVRLFRSTVRSPHLRVFVVILTTGKSKAVAT